MKIQQKSRSEDMKVLILDNYDSFTYNLYQYVGEILDANLEEKFQVDVYRNDEISLNEIEKKDYECIIISPGPGHPDDEKYFGVCSAVLSHLRNTRTLGVCLGMQGLASSFGGRVIQGSLPMHGKMSTTEHDGTGVFEGLPTPLEAMRYHSLIVEPETLPDCFVVSAKCAVASDPHRFEIMAIRHKELPMEGIQFHPESFGTEGGKTMLYNFLFRSLPSS